MKMIDNEIKKQIDKNMNIKNDHLSIYATKDDEAIRFASFTKDDIRTSFFHDIDTIIHSLSYTRYIDKTQVFTNCYDDHVTKRIIHVQLVNKIAKTIGRALALNEDLIEAISLGHDIGHVPFGHVGEAILSKISLKNGEGYFMHNVQSVRNFLFLEKNGMGSNLTIQVLDGILSHNGEILSNVYRPVKKTSSEFLDEYNACYKDKEKSLKIAPMTLEGCVVRISDVIAYIGRDIEDSIRLGMIEKTDIPDDITSVLGSSNRDIINTIVLDIIENSLNQNYIKMSEKVFNALNDLKDFNYKNIYYKANNDESLKKYENIFNRLFDHYLDALKKKKYNSDIYDIYLNNMDEKYIESNSMERIVLDYLAGMTDNFIQKMYLKNIEGTLDKV